MTELTAQQSAILTEGICPLCEGEIHPTAVANFWHCPACNKGYELVSAQSQPHRFTEWRCPHCLKMQLSVHGLNTSSLQCGHCDRVTEMRFQT